MAAWYVDSPTQAAGIRVAGRTVKLQSALDPTVNSGENSDWDGRSEQADAKGGRNRKKGSLFNQEMKGLVTVGSHAQYNTRAQSHNGITVGSSNS